MLCIYYDKWLTALLEYNGFLGDNFTVTNLHSDIAKFTDPLIAVRAMDPVTLAYPLGTTWTHLPGVEYPAERDATVSAKRPGVISARQREACNIIS